MVTSHASRPCQNHSGFALIAAAIIRLTSPETASLPPVANGLSRRYSAVAAAARQSDVSAPAALPRHG